MYKVSYYMGGGTNVSFRWFKTLSEATDFSIKQAVNAVLEIKYYPEETTRENRT